MSPPSPQPGVTAPCGRPQRHVPGERMQQPQPAVLEHPAPTLHGQETLEEAEAWGPPVCQGLQLHPIMAKNWISPKVSAQPLLSANAWLWRRAAQCWLSLALPKSLPSAPSPCCVRASSRGFAGVEVSHAGTAAPREVWHVAVSPDRRNVSSSECRPGHTSQSHPSGDPPSPTARAWEWGQVGPAQPPSQRMERDPGTPLGWKVLHGKDQMQQDKPCTKAGLQLAPCGGGFEVTRVLPNLSGASPVPGGSQ